MVAFTLLATVGKHLLPEARQSRRDIFAFLRVEAASQRLIPTGEQSGLQTFIAATESISLCTRMKS